MIIDSLNDLALQVPRVALHLEHLGMVRAKQHSPSPTNGMEAERPNNINPIFVHLFN